VQICTDFFWKINYFYTPFISNTNLFNYGKPQKFFKKQLLPQQLCIASIQRQRETENVAKPKTINQLYFQLGISVQANVAAWDVLKK
jgi:hypothetical protein